MSGMLAGDGWLFDLIVIPLTALVVAGVFAYRTHAGERRRRRRRRSRGGYIL